MCDLDESSTHTFIYSFFIQWERFIKCLWCVRHNDTIIFFPCYRRGIKVWLRSPTRHTKEIETQVCGPKAQQSFSLSPLGFGLGCSPATADRGASSTFLVLLLLSKPLRLNAFERARAFPHRKIAVRLGFFYAYKNKFKSKNAHFKILN